MEFDKLREIVSKRLKIPAEQISADSRFIEDLCADSVDVFEIVFDMEDEFQADLGGKGFDDFLTVGDLYRCLCSVKVK